VLKLFSQSQFTSTIHSSIFKIIWLCIWVALLSLEHRITAQELPPIDNFSPVDYGAENQNWGISQSKEKNIYIANNGGLLEFNGAVWKLYGSPNGSTIRSVKAKNNVVYTGCYMEFGLWEKDAYGDLRYTSISANLSIPLVEDEEFWNILALDDRVLFQSLERIYIYNTTDESVKIVDSKSTKAHMFDFKGTIYFHSTVNGLFKIENGKSILVSNNPIIMGSAITGFFFIDQKPLLVTEKGQFFFLDNNNLVEWKTEFNQTTNTINVYSSLQLEDESIVLGTISNGLYHIGKDGKVLLKINQEKGLNNNTVLSVFEDDEHNLWLALDNGISIVNMDSPFNEYIDKNGKLGVVYASSIYKDILYLGTNQGLFYKSLNTDEEFDFMEGTEGQVWFLKEVNGVLFCGHNKGTFEIDNSKAELISNFPGTWDIKPIPNKNNLLLQGNFEGLSILENLNGTWRLKNVIKGFDISSRFFEFIDTNTILVNHEFKGIFTLNIDEDYLEVNKVQNKVPKGIGASLVTYLGDILYTCDNGIFKYDQLANDFVADSLLTGAFYKNLDNPIGIFIADEQSKRLWCFTDNSIAYASPAKFDKNSKVSRIAIPTYVRKNLGVLGFESITPLENERYLIGISNGYLTFNLNKLEEKAYDIVINSISTRSNISSFDKVHKADIANFDYSNNNVLFTFSVPEFDKYNEVNYQYKLKGIYDDWSDWVNTAEASFENLPFGDYTFEIRAKIGNDLSINTASFAFRVERPWYLSNRAIILYVIGVALFGLFVHKMYKNYYRKQREQILKDSKKKLKRKKLKAQKKIVQIRNEKLREEIDSKNRELAISTMSIIKKNEFLNAIKDQLKGDVENSQVRSVIRTIDRNINNTDDWKFFEDAFNNADKDFLKKVKSVHPELTANDLRLCAYLRLNLSSKEIAPLLNISVRSVEVKRYRLRKKINLPHEESLTDYIMEL